MPTNAKKKRKFSAIQTASSFSVSSFNASVNECKKRNVHIAFLCIDRGGGDDVPMSTTNCCCQPISSAPFFSFSFPLPLWSSSQTRPIHQVKIKIKTAKTFSNLDCSSICRRPVDMADVEMYFFQYQKASWRLYRFVSLTIKEKTTKSKAIRNTDRCGEREEKPDETSKAGHISYCG